MSVRAKMVCVSVEITKGDKSWHYKENNTEPLDVVEVVLRPVVAGASEENKEFFASTPSGVVQLSILRPEAAGWFEKDKEYYVDFTKVN